MQHIRKTQQTQNKFLLECAILVYFSIIIIIYNKSNNYIFFYLEPRDLAICNYDFILIIFQTNYIST